jgi:hypothetical protein
MTKILPRIELSETLLRQGIQDTNFFNGRLLTAGDLETMQSASRKRDVQLGQAAGAGVVSGLEVKLVADGSDGKPPVLAVSCGLAFNRLGQAVSLPVDTEVALAEEKPASAKVQSLFDPCPYAQTSGKPLPGKGAYIFVARPAIGFSGLAPRRGFGQAAKVEGCDRALLQDGVQFRLVPFDNNKLDKLSADTRKKFATLLSDVGKSGSAGLAARNKLRNCLAHACFGTEELSAWPVDPFPSEKDDFLGPAQVSAYLTYGLLDQLEQQALIDDCDVPLALVCWTTGGVKWVDMWSVRRRTTPRSTSLAWPLFAGARRLAEAEAVFLQFQDQIQAMKSQSDLSSVKATDYFRYLPSCGILPITTEFLKKYMADNKSQVSIPTTQQKGVAPSKFFESLTCRAPAFIEGAKVHSLLHESLYYPPVDLNSQEMLWLYVVRENTESIEQGQSQPYLIFTTGHMPYHGNVRFDSARWDFSNYAFV